MRVYHGRSVTGGIAVGRIAVYNSSARQVRRLHITDAEEELARYREAKTRGIAELRKLCERTREELGKSHAAIFEIHQMLMKDYEFNASIEDLVRGQMVNAEYAVAATRDRLVSAFASMDDEYMKGRAADIRDISERLIRILSGDGYAASETEGPVIVIADNVTPSEIIQADRSRVIALVTVHGSPTSHAAILARAMGIPVITAVEIPLDETVDDRTGIVDGGEGTVYVDPDPETLAWVRRRQQEEREEREFLETLKGKETVTLDGRRVMLRANIGNVRDISAVWENDADGVGLFRSEFLYFEQDHLPTEEEQFLVYREAAEALRGEKLIIRTMDIGADKQCGCLPMEPEENPALGYRAIRIGLTQTELLRAQIGALLRASVYGDLAVMYPMITSLSEVRRIREIVQEVKADLDARGIPYGEPEQGIMIETPAAALISDVLAAEVDFFSVGTNDLTQYTLAIDRQNTKLDAFYDPYHPAILRMISMVIENAHRAGIWAGICGELGADESLTREFLAMGVDELSVAPGRILPIRKLIRETNVSEFTERKNDCSRPRSGQ